MSITMTDIKNFEKLFNFFSQLAIEFASIETTFFDSVVFSDTCIVF